LARALELSKGELVEWSVQDKHALVLRRMAGEPAAEGKKKRRRS
jgi:hypothetical protein